MERGLHGLIEILIRIFQKPYGRPCRHPEPGGGLFSTGADLDRFCQMLLNGGTWQGKRYPFEPALAEICKKQTGKLDQKYGLGMGVGQDGHGGAHGTSMTIYPQTHTV